MAEDKNNEELVFDGMPGADKKTEEDVKPFEVDMNFDNTEEEEVEEAQEEEETTEEEPVAEEATEEVAEEQVEEPVAQEAESPEQTEEQESVPTDDGQPVEAVEEEPEVETKAPMVPKSRLDEVLAKNKEMQKIIQTLEEKPAEDTTPKYDFVAKEKHYQDLVLEGQVDKAAELREEIRTAEREQVMAEMQSKMGQTVQQDRENRELQQKAQEIVV